MGERLTLIKDRGLVALWPGSRGKPDLKEHANEPEPPGAELIDAKKYPRMEFYPGWKQFVRDWNEYAGSTRRSLQIERFDRENELRFYENATGIAGLRAALANAEQGLAAQDEKYQSIKHDAKISRKEKTGQLKEARRTRRRVHNRLMKVEEDDRVERGDLEEDVEDARAALAQSDKTFLLARDESNVVFYAHIFLHGDEDARDDLFGAFAARSEGTQRGNLFSVFYRFFSFADRFYEIESSTHEEVVRKAWSEVDRFLDRNSAPAVDQASSDNDGINIPVLMM